MKRNTNVLLSGFLVMGMALTACADLDTTIKADLSTKALAEKDFAGVRFTVDNHVVTLSGECPTEKSKSTVEAKAKGLYGVENVVNNITIAPVVIGTDQQLKQGVDSVLKQYAGVEAITRDSIVYLQGAVEREKIKKLTDAITSLKPRNIENRLALR